MGGSSSSSSTNQKYNTTYINQADTNLINTNVNNFVADTVVKQAKGCSASISQLQSIDISNIQAEKDVTIGGAEQSQTAGITFDCVQVSDFQNEIGNGVLTKYMDAIENSFSTDALDKMEAIAATAAQNNMGSTGGSKSNSNSNIDYKFTSKNTTRTNIENVIKNSISNNLTMENVQNCISQIHNSQFIKLSDITSTTGSVKIGVLSQEQGAEMMTSCMQNSSDTNKITTGITSELGLTLDNTNSQKKSTEITTTATSEATNKGVGDAMSQFLAGLADLISSLFSGMYAPFAIAVVVCMILCCIISVAAIAFQGMSGNGESGDDITSNIEDIAMEGDAGGDIEEQTGGFVKTAIRIFSQANRNK